jgi:UDP-N-acetylmuramoyl-tripeptide--D-alanyl-D-alanine ligase
VTGSVAAFALTAGMVAQAAGGRLVSGPADRAFDSVSIDSRTLAPGALFVAIRGDRFDGHAFIGAAIARGATGVMVAATHENAGDAAVVQVSDTLEGLQAAAREVRRRSGARVVAITGSAGKTTTKEIAADLLAVRFRVARNTGNLNNHIGLPLSLFELRHGPDVAVMELGMNHAGEIRTLVGIAEPDVRVWLNVGDAHLGYFGTREKIADAKAEILENAGPASVAVVSADDPLVIARAARWPGRTVTFGESPGALVRATRVVDRGLDGISADVTTPAGPLSLTIPLPGRAHLLNVLAGVAIALEFQVPLEAIAPHIAALRPVARRGTLTPLAGGAFLVNDSYNASPAAVQAMLAALGATAVTGRRIAVLGEMLELGDASRRLHEACGRAAAAARVDELVAIGGAAADGYLDGAMAGGLAATHTLRFADSASAAPAVAALVRPGDVVLVKGSRGMRTDIVADRLLESGEGEGG